MCMSSAFNRGGAEGAMIGGLRGAVIGGGAWAGAEGALIGGGALGRS